VPTLEGKLQPSPKGICTPYLGFPLRTSCDGEPGQRALPSLLSLRTRPAPAWGVRAGLSLLLSSPSLTPEASRSQSHVDTLARAFKLCPHFVFVCLGVCECLAICGARPGGAVPSWNLCHLGPQTARAWQRARGEPGLRARRAPAGGAGAPRRGCCRQRELM
jgi:hypothetical protein